MTARLEGGPDGVWRLEGTLEWRGIAHRRGVDLTLGNLPEPVRRLAGLAGVERLLTGERAPVDLPVP